MDTLEEIADILGSAEQTGTVLKRILGLESGKVDKEAGKGLVAVDATLAVQGAAADAKAVGDALRSGFTEWGFSGDGYTEGHTYTIVIDSSEEEGYYDYMLYDNGTYVDLVTLSTDSAIGIDFNIENITATRHLITPTKTSQLTNDSGFLTQHQDVSGKLDGAAAYPEWDDMKGDYEVGDVISFGGGLYVSIHGGNGADTPPLDSVHWAETTIQSLLAAKANASDVNAALAQKASLADLPYRLVEPGKWEFSGLSGEEIGASMFFSDGSWMLYLVYEGTETDSAGPVEGTANDLVVDFSEAGSSIVATRASLPGHLCDRAVNAVPVASATTLTLPEKIDGKSRNFCVRLTVSAAGDGSAVTFAATDSGGDAVAWDSMGDPSGTFAEGTYLYRFTEVADGVFHAADITSGGSIDPAVLGAKLNSTSAGPNWAYPVAYEVGAHVTYLGVLYECVVAYATTSSSNPPPNDLYDTSTTPATGHWKVTDMSVPDATFDVMSNGFARLVGADGTLLWQQGYNLNGTTSASPSDGGVNAYAFAANATDGVSLVLPSVTSGKVGDFILDITNPALDSGATGYPTAFSTSNTYAVGAIVSYNSQLWRCTTAVGTAGSWTGDTNWELAYPYFSLPSTAAYVVPKGINISDILSFAPGTTCELYFTLTSFAFGGKPTWKVARQDVEAVS